MLIPFLELLEKGLIHKHYALSKDTILIVNAELLIAKKKLAHREAELSEKDLEILRLKNIILEQRNVTKNVTKDVTNIIKTAFDYNIRNLEIAKPVGSSKKQEYPHRSQTRTSGKILFYFLVWEKGSPQKHPYNSTQSLKSINESRTRQCSLPSLTRTPNYKPANAPAHERYFAKTKNLPLAKNR
jgi:hypothetical protein